MYTEQYKGFTINRTVGRAGYLGFEAINNQDNTWVLVGSSLSIQQFRAFVSHCINVQKQNKSEEV